MPKNLIYCRGKCLWIGQIQFAVDSPQTCTVFTLFQSVLLAQSMSHCFSLFAYHFSLSLEHFDTRLKFQDQTVTINYHIIFNIGAAKNNSKARGRLVLELKQHI